MTLPFGAVKLTEPLFAIWSGASLSPCCRIVRWIRLACGSVPKAWYEQGVVLQMAGEVWGDGCIPDLTPNCRMDIYPHRFWLAGPVGAGCVHPPASAAMTEHGASCASRSCWLFPHVAPKAAHSQPRTLTTFNLDANGLI